ncbi:hypothetical protein M011DRAFT_472942 [Sporormia fimetaria CBS 119925]|uniref:Uncharacterized protein n=1 Tax=Sporormia fimetaria CBS 119925 TaxID=1340428 RepID=A0A6A6UW31_9PLEO|nr:hypothetical protein M011DRAFT_472942 [Sporormia fimetaria CBS 119925]
MVREAVRNSETTTTYDKYYTMDQLHTRGTDRTANIEDDMLEEGGSVTITGHEANLTSHHWSGVTPDEIPYHVVT